MPSQPIDPTWTVNDTLRHYPPTAAVFNHFGVDSCCGGGATIEAAATDAGLSAAALLFALHAAAGVLPAAEAGR